MASDIEFVDFIVDQVSHIGEVVYKKMFGEYALYCNGKVVGLICKNKLFVKITEAGKEFAGDIDEASPYKGARPSFLIQEQVDDKEWISKLIEVTEKDLPKPKPKKPRKNVFCKLD